MKYRVCEYCGDNLDPGEKCECRNDAKVRTNMFLNMFESDMYGQFRLKMEDMMYERDLATK